MANFKFYLKPGQTPPIGSSGIALLDGGIVWIGDKWPDKNIEAHVMSANELAEYEAFQKFMSVENEWRILFSEVWPKDETALATKISAIKTKLDTVASEMRSA